MGRGDEVQIVVRVVVWGTPPLSEVDSRIRLCNILPGNELIAVSVFVEDILGGLNSDANPRSRSSA